jgi:hypothetical protein
LHPFSKYFYNQLTTKLFYRNIVLNNPGNDGRWPLADGRHVNKNRLKVGQRPSVIGHR